jgi:hypothetical protein
MKRELLAGVAMALVWSGVAMAQEGAPPSYPPFPRTPAAATELPPGYPPVDSSKVPHPIMARFQTGRPLLHWASFNGYGCTSLKATSVFIFGSCRDFYSEPRLKGPPPSALPPWSARTPGPGGAAAGENAGCPNCNR